MEYNISENREENFEFHRAPEEPTAYEAQEEQATQYEGQPEEIVEEVPEKSDSAAEQEKEEEKVEKRKENPKRKSKKKDNQTLPQFEVPTIYQHFTRIAKETLPNSTVVTPVETQFTTIWTRMFPDTDPKKALESFSYKVPPVMLRDWAAECRELWKRENPTVKWIVKSEHFKGLEDLTKPPPKGLTPQYYGKLRLQLKHIEDYFVKRRPNETSVMDGLVWLAVDSLKLSVDKIIRLKNNLNWAYDLQLSLEPQKTHQRQKTISVNKFAVIESATRSMGVQELISGGTLSPRTLAENRDLQQREMFVIRDLCAIVGSFGENPTQLEREKYEEDLLKLKRDTMKKVQDLTSSLNVLMSECSFQSTSLSNSLAKHSKNVTVDAGWNEVLESICTLKDRMVKVNRELKDNNTLLAMTILVRTGFAIAGLITLTQKQTVSEGEWAFANITPTLRMQLDSWTKISPSEEQSGSRKRKESPGELPEAKSQKSPIPEHPQQ